MIVTIMSDASFCHRTKASGWGVWIRSSRGTFESGGNFKNDPGHATEAEAMALSIAVFIAFRYGIADKGDKLVIQTDCLQNVHYYTGAGRCRNRRIAETIKYTKEMIEGRACTFDVRHVRAHCPTAGKRNYVNNICDKMARLYMRKLRTERRKAA